MGNQSQAFLIIAKWWSANGQGRMVQEEMLSEFWVSGLDEFWLKPKESNVLAVKAPNRFTPSGFVVKELISTI